jgi:hypothetical protein
MHQKSASEKINLFNAPILMQKFLTSAPAFAASSELEQVQRQNRAEPCAAISDQRLV